MSVAKTERDMLARLRVKFRAPEYAFIRHVRNSTGFSKKPRTIDAMVMGLWPSRGLELQGIEIKVSRGDWLREIKEPEKQEPFFRYCDRFWLAVGDSKIVKDGELPSTWGLIVPRGDGLAVKVQAPLLKPEPLTREFLAAIMRRADSPERTKEIEDRAKDKATAEVKEKLEEAKGLRRKVWELEANKDVTDHRAPALEAFEKSSGVTLSKWNLDAVRKTGRLVRAIELMGPDSFRRIETNISNAAERLADRASKLSDIASHLKDGVDAMDGVSE